jgi:hypothetical protein
VVDRARLESACPQGPRVRIPASPPVFEVNRPSRTSVAFDLSCCGREPCEGS